MDELSFVKRLLPGWTACLAASPGGALPQRSGRIPAIVDMPRKFGHMHAVPLPDYIHV
jgi:hypothetical protein